jgi:hypothetical protein
MEEKEYTYWTSPDGWLVGYWNDYPEHTTQGRDRAELEFMLRDLRSFIDEGVFKDAPRHSGVMEFA